MTERKVGLGGLDSDTVQTHNYFFQKGILKQMTREVQIHKTAGRRYKESNSKILWKHQDAIHVLLLQVGDNFVSLHQAENRKRFKRYFFH